MEQELIENDKKESMIMKRVNGIEMDLTSEEFQIIQKFVGIMNIWSDEFNIHYAPVYRHKEDDHKIMSFWIEQIPDE